MTDRLAVTDRAMRRARTWLSRRRFGGIEPTPLLAARLEIRRRGLVGLVAVMAFVALLAIALLDRLAADSAPTRFAGFVTVMLVAILARWLWQYVVRRGEQRLAAALTRRSAHPVAIARRDVLGRWGLVATALLYAGVLGIAVAIAALAQTTQDLATAGVLGLALVVVAAMTAGELSGILRRPALAEDAGSLAVDDALRTDDARGVLVSPVPALLATFTVMSVSPQVASSLYAFCYAFIGLAFAASVWREWAAGSAKDRGSAATIA